jgi:HAD superfamily hydrolase (TIGR01509 family)
MKIIFDLSEVLIMGLVGVEKRLSPLLDLPEDKILQCFGGPLLQAICRGELSEEEYLEQIVNYQGWHVPIDILKMRMRENFHQKVDGTLTIMKHLAIQHEVVLLSDHAREWIAYIKTAHPFLGEFRRTFFSYEIGKTKKEPEAFQEVLKVMGYKAEECLLIDDSINNIEVAASLGINGIHFRNAGQLQEQLAIQETW